MNGRPSGVSRLASRSERSDELEYFSCVDAEWCSKALNSCADPLVEDIKFVAVDCLHRRLKLALMRMERIELCADVSTDVLAVVWLIGLPQQKGVRPVVGDAVLSVEVRVTGSNDPFARQEASVAVVRVQPIPFPRIVTEYDLRLEFANRLGDVAPLAQAAVEFAVDKGATSEGAALVSQLLSWSRPLQAPDVGDYVTVGLVDGGHLVGEVSDQFEDGTGFELAAGLDRLLVELAEVASLQVQS